MVGGEDNETPFAHVPEFGAGPIPSQVGPFTWDKVAASAGTTSAYRRGRTPLWAVAALVLVGLAFVALMVLTIAGALT
jgi:hypothetical protein